MRRCRRQNQEDVIFDTLWRAGGAIVTHDQLHEALYPDGNYCESNVVRVIVMRLRKQVRGIMRIRTIHGKGYTMNRITP